MSTTRTFPQLGSVFAAEAYQWLQDNAPEYADALAAEVANGATSDEVRAFALRVTEGYRGPFVTRLKLAADHLVKQRQGGAT